VIDDCYLKELLAICNEEHTDGRARVTMDEERVYSKTLMIPDDSTTPDDGGTRSRSMNLNRDICGILLILC